MIDRIIFDKIKNQFFTGKSIVVLGPRQVGKTTLVKELGKIQNEKVLELNADLSIVRENLTEPSLESLKTIIGNAKFVIIDEAQRIKNIGLTLKIIHDNMSDIQLLVTGSSALELVNEINEPMTGRKWEYKLYPISWEELQNNTNYIQAHSQLETRLLYGMYPDVINNPGQEKQILNQLSSSYLYKDLLAFRGIRKPEILEKLLRALAFQVGNEVSFNELSQIVEIDKITIENYINLLEQAFVVFRLQPLSRNLRNEINTSRKIYFYDNGIRNAIIDNFNPINLRNDIGALWENFMISERMKLNHYHDYFGKTYFWRTHAKQEIDYIEEANGTFSAFEFKWNPKAKSKFPKTFIDSYLPKATQIIHRDNFNAFLMPF